MRDTSFVCEQLIEPTITRYLHALNVGLDANYRLKRKDVSGDTADPGLSHGWSYFVDDRGFRVYLKPHESDVEDKSTCSRHDAVNLADIRPGQGYAATGVGTVECTRHNMKRASAVGDLQKGERYALQHCFLSIISQTSTDIVIWTTSSSRALPEYPSRCSSSHTILLANGR